MNFLCKNRDESNFWCKKTEESHGMLAAASTA